MNSKEFFNKELKNLIAYVLLVARDNTVYGSVRLAKVVDILSMKNDLRYKIIWASLGPYTFKQNKALRYMENNELIKTIRPNKEANYYTIHLTETGKKFIRGEIKAPIVGLPKKQEIRSLLRKDLDSLIDDTIELFVSIKCHVTP